MMNMTTRDKQQLINQLAITHDAIKTADKLFRLRKDPAFQKPIWDTLSGIEDLLDLVAILPTTESKPTSILGRLLNFKTDQDLISSPQSPDGSRQNRDGSPLSAIRQ